MLNAFFRKYADDPPLWVVILFTLVVLSVIVIGTFIVFTGVLTIIAAAFGFAIKLFLAILGF